MSKDDIVGFSLIPFVLLGIIFREDLFDFAGIILNHLFAFVG